MKSFDYDICVIGGGPAGMAAALSAAKHSNAKICIVDREKYLGGILLQCIHNGFGLQRFKEELTGPEYAERFSNPVLNNDQITTLMDTGVLNIEKYQDGFLVIMLSPQKGMLRTYVKSIILSMGCRERSRGAIAIPGSRPSGIFTAGLAQKFVNMDGYLPGKRVVILGSGDIGLIMARRMKYEGADVLGVFEIMQYSSGLTRNIVQCLDDNNIPLYLGRTVSKIYGNNRVEGVVTSKVDKNMRPIHGTEEDIRCDTLLLSVGLIPENELSSDLGIEINPTTNGPIVNGRMETTVPGVFACGNVVHVHDIVDYVSNESDLAGIGAAEYISDSKKVDFSVKTIPDNKISYIVPNYISKTRTATLYMRVTEPMNNVKISFGGFMSFKKEFVRPGEMISIRATPKLMEKLDGNELKIGIEE